MNKIKVISVMNEAMIEFLKEKKLNYEKNQKVEELLKDESLFFKINKAKAYEILQAVGVKDEQLENVYQELISKNVFYDLLNRGKVNENDDNLIIKYEHMGYDDLFKKKN